MKDQTENSEEQVNNVEVSKEITIKIKYLKNNFEKCSPDCPQIRLGGAVLTKFYHFKAKCEYFGESIVDHYYTEEEIKGITVRKHIIKKSVRLPACIKLFGSK